MFGKKNKIDELEDVIDEKDNQIYELKDKLEWVEKSRDACREENQRLSNQLETLSTMMKSLPPHQLRQHKLPSAIYGDVVYHRRHVKAFTSPEDLAFKPKDYILLESQNETRTQLVRIEKIQTIKMGESFKVYEDLGFKTQNKCDLCMEMLYPSAEKGKTIVYVYYVDVIN